MSGEVLTVAARAAFIRQDGNALRMTLRDVPGGKEVDVEVRSGFDIAAASVDVTELQRMAGTMFGSRPIDVLLGELLANDASIRDKAKRFVAAAVAVRSIDEGLVGVLESAFSMGYSAGLIDVMRGVKGWPK